MSIDEFLQNIWTAEEGQAMAAAMLGNAHPPPPPPPPPQSEHEGGGLLQSNLQQAGSFTLPLPRTLSRKTVDEVWKEIQGLKRQQEREEEQHQEQEHKQQQRVQGGFGEMTLEDFLVKAGIVRDDTDVGPVVNSFASTFAAAGRPAPQADVETIAQQHNQQQQLEWYNYQLKQQQQQRLLQQQQAEAAATMLGVAKRTGPIGGMMLAGNVLETPLDIAPGNLASGLSLSPGLATPDLASKRRGFDVVERTVERRQRRMIKNRESAARSRARKQAYTMELETEVMQLKEENLRLKRQRLCRLLRQYKNQREHQYVSFEESTVHIGDLACNYSRHASFGSGSKCH
ncbi:hypothetical protein O6H91_17G075500 [Diphasiastrum complanatum]|uniref:Uncharacterized protein n=1 Tax=Diphasiastrum complanatum TaxID=34168 RepID=A0ACC2B893_DIPCM|nr:hypothetical protein O6H91_17G075500 [Diphasiastrum complanatum]